MFEISINWSNNSFELLSLCDWSCAYISLHWMNMNSKPASQSASQQTRNACHQYKSRVLRLISEHLMFLFYVEWLKCLLALFGLFVCSFFHDFFASILYKCKYFNALEMNTMAHFDWNCNRSNFFNSIENFWTQDTLNRIPYWEFYSEQHTSAHLFTHALWRAVVAIHSLLLCLWHLIHLVDVCRFSFGIKLDNVIKMFKYCECAD